MTEAETLSDLLHRRHSCRAFRQEPVPDDMIERIVTIAGRAPSWCNAQPWQVIVTRPAETDRLRDALAAHARSAPTAPDIVFPERYGGLHQERRRACGRALYEAVGIARGDREASSRQMFENFRFFGAPHVALVTTEAELGTYGAVDCGAFVTVFTLAAEASGVASIPQAAIASHSPFLREWFGLPDNRQVVCGISFGFKDSEHPANAFRTDRAPIGEILTWAG